MTCRNTDLIFDLRRQITELTRANEGLETALREHAALASAEIERLQRTLEHRHTLDCDMVKHLNCTRCSCTVLL